MLVAAHLFLVSAFRLKDPLFCLKGDGASRVFQVLGPDVCGVRSEGRLSIPAHCTVALNAAACASACASHSDCSGAQLLARDWSTATCSLFFSGSTGADGSLLAAACVAISGDRVLAV